MGIVKRCKLPICKQKLLLNLFIAGCTARAAAPIVSVNRETAKLFFRKLRKRLYDYHISESRKLNGIVEIDECYTSSGYGGRETNFKNRSIKKKFIDSGPVLRLALEHYQKAQMAELADATDSKSVDLAVIRVRPPFWVLKNVRIISRAFFFVD